MFLIGKVHPFADGNGRIARVMMNAELVRPGEVRMVVPTVYRLTYLSALRVATRTGNDAALIATLSFAQRWLPGWTGAAGRARNGVCCVHTRCATPGRQRTPGSASSCRDGRRATNSTEPVR